MILALLLHLTPPASACEDLEPVPDSLQVAWISRLSERVGADDWLEVVRVKDLRGWIRANSADPVRVLQALGMIKRKVSRRAERREYKVTIFDVRSEWVCRPVTDTAPGQDVGGAVACEERQQDALRRHRHGFTGCGYSLDTRSSTRGLEVFRVRWADASTWGFCVMPMDRFLEGA